ncbi:hypothetical protein ACQX4F_11660 [Corynebacterium diphtheriae]
MIKVVFDHVVDLEDSGAAGDQATGGTGIDNAGGRWPREWASASALLRVMAALSVPMPVIKVGILAGMPPASSGAAITMRGRPLLMSILPIVAPLGR